MGIITLPKPHPGQQLIEKNRKRYNHIRCGRRWGKTFVIAYLLLIALKGKKVGIWFPTYKDLHKVWRNVKRTYASAIVEKDETIKSIRFVNGGEADFWSMHDPDQGRGFFYDRAIIDEGAKANRMQEAWEDTIRPTLTDRKGDAFIFSTPKGKTNFFYTLSQKMRNMSDWAFFHFTSYDNPYLDKSEIDGHKMQMDKISFDQEYLAEYVDANDRPFMYSFDEKIHVIHDFKYNPHLDLWLSFDFNVDPMTCILAQQLSIKSLRIFETIRLENSGTAEMCKYILAKYPGARYIATGDATGSKRSTSAGGGISDWYLIKRILNLSDAQIRKRSVNIKLGDSRTLCNSIIQNADIRVTENCRDLINDWNLAAVDEFGELIKEQSQTGLHFFDCGRYLLDAMFPDFITNFKKYQ